MADDTRQRRPHILILGGGYVGMYTALQLDKKLRRDEATVTVIDPPPAMICFCTDGSWTWGSEKATSIGSVSVITATPLVSPGVR